MTKKTRFIVFLICVVVFLIITPYIILYSLGYRVDFENKKIVATGGLYIKALPEGADIMVDAKIDNKTGIFSNAVFVQNLLPKQHQVTIKKDGYYDYQKNLVVTENKVTKLEDVILFKQKMAFDLLENNVDYFSLSPNGSNALLAKIGTKKINFEIINLANQQKQNFSLAIKNGAISDSKWSDDPNMALIDISDSHFLIDLSLQDPKITALPLLTGAKNIYFNPQDSSQIFYIKSLPAQAGKNLYSNKDSDPILKNVVAYQLKKNNIIWLSYDGFLYHSDINGASSDEISLKAFPVKKNTAYKIMALSNATFLQEADSLFLLNPDSKIFENFSQQIKDVKISPDGRKMIYSNDHQISLFYLDGTDTKKTLIKSFPENITDYYWLNSDYVALNLQNNIAISEIDYRGNVNIIYLPQTLTMNGGKDITIKTPKIIFNQQDKKLYILNQNNLLSSERLIP